MTRIARSLSLMLLFAGLVSTARAQSFGVVEALKVTEFAGRSPISLSADGEWVAYTISDNSKRKTYGDKRYQFYTPTGAFLEALGCDIWISNTRTHESRNLTEGKGTSWDPVWSPDGRYLAFYSDRSGVAHLWLWEKATGQMRQLGNDVVRPFFNFQVPRWTPDSTHLLARTLSRGMTVEGEADRQYGPEQKPDAAPAKDPNATTVSILSYNPAQAEKAVADKPQEAHADESVEWLKRYETDLTLIDIRTGASDHLVTGERPLGYWFSPDGTMLAWTHMKGPVGNTQQVSFDLRLLQLSSRSSRTLVSGFNQEYGISVSWSPDSKSLAYTTAGQLAKGDAYLVHAQGGEPVLLTPGEHAEFGDDHRAPLWDSKGEYIYLISTETYTRRAAPGIWKTSVSHPALVRVADIPGRVIREIVAPTAGGRFWSPDQGASMIVAAREEETKKQSFYKVNLTSGAATQLYEAEQYFGGDPIFHLDGSADGKSFVFVSQDAQHPEEVWNCQGDMRTPVRVSSVHKDLEHLAFGASRIIDYYSIDGEHLHGALLLPGNYQSGKRYPLIVDPYGGSFRSNSVFRFGLSGAGVENLQILATRGYAVLLPDTPIHTNSPMYEIMKTVIPAVDRAVELGIADPDHLGIMGHSYGGYSTLSVIVQSTRFKAAVDSAGPGDLISDYGIMDPKGGTFAIGWAETGQGKMGGTPWQFRDRYIENSPIFYLDRVQTPLLIIQGNLDSTVPHQQAEEVFVGLRRLGKEVTYANYGGEDHWEGTWGLANATDYWTRVLNWFDVHLKPAPETSK
jgi:dipeptidyl aminopeptidase/acylaminoacyl peptidase